MNCDRDGDGDGDGDRDCDRDIYELVALHQKMNFFSFRRVKL